MHLDHSGLEILDPHECRTLLARATIGRIAFVDRALPAVQPVTYTLDDDVVIRTAWESRLAVAGSDTVVAFEVDEFEAAARVGWSVVVIGHARLVTEPDRLDALRKLSLQTWTPGYREYFITIRPELVSGRRIPQKTRLPEAAKPRG